MAKSLFGYAEGVPVDGFIPKQTESNKVVAHKLSIKYFPESRYLSKRYSGNIYGKGLERITLLSQRERNFKD